MEASRNTHHSRRKQFDMRATGLRCSFTKSRGGRAYRRGRNVRRRSSSPNDMRLGARRSVASVLACPLAPLQRRHRPPRRAPIQMSIDIESTPAPLDERHDGGHDRLALMSGRRSPRAVVVACRLSWSVVFPSAEFGLRPFRGSPLQVFRRPDRPAAAIPAVVLLCGTAVEVAGHRPHPAIRGTRCRRCCAHNNPANICNCSNYARLL